MKKTSQLIFIAGLACLLVLSGCTSTDITDFAKSMPEVQAFLKENPNADIKVSLWTKAEVAKNIGEISAECEKPNMEAKAMYHAVVIDETKSLNLSVWADAETRQAICISKKGTGENVPVAANCRKDVELPECEKGKLKVARDNDGCITEYKCVADSACPETVPVPKEFCENGRIPKYGADGCIIGYACAENTCAPVERPEKGFCENGKVIPVYNENKCIVGFSCETAVNTQECPQLVPPSQELLDECAKKGGNISRKADDNGCITGYECAEPNAGGALEAPVLKISEQEERNVKMEWNRVLGASVYNIYKSKNGGEFYYYAGGIRNTYFKDYDLGSGVKYGYYVVAISEDGTRKSGPSNRVGAQVGELPAVCPTVAIVVSEEDRKACAEKGGTIKTTYRNGCPYGYECALTFDPLSQCTNRQRVYKCTNPADTSTPYYEVGPPENTAGGAITYYTSRGEVYAKCNPSLGPDYAYQCKNTADFTCGNNLCDATDCAKEGENYSKVYTDRYPTQCCSGLTEWESGMDTRKVVDGKCVETGMASGNPVGTCISAGDGICGPLENICNSPNDCPAAEPREQMSIERAIEIAKTSQCTDEGSLKTETASYNENSATWWIDLDVKKEGCSPACVVSADGSAEVNWRCTGLITAETTEE